MLFACIYGFDRLWQRKTCLFEWFWWKSNIASKSPGGPLKVSALLSSCATMVSHEYYFIEWFCGWQCSWMEVTVTVNMSSSRSWICLSFPSFLCPSVLSSRYSCLVFPLLLFLFLLLLFTFIFNTMSYNNAWLLYSKAQYTLSLSTLSERKVEMMYVFYIHWDFYVLYIE